MEKRKLGQSELSIAPIVFGANVCGWTVNQKQSEEILDAFLDYGFNMIDTANNYAIWADGLNGGDSERVLGQWFKSSGKRDKVILSTKVGKTIGDGSKGLKKEYIFKCVEDSLKRLNTDYIDLYHSHEDDKETPFEETLEAYDVLIKQGKVRYIASSNYEASRLQEILDVSKAKGLPSYVAHQPCYNLYDREVYEAAIEKTCVDNGLGVISYFSLASGFLTGKYRNADDLQKSARGPLFVKKYLTDRGVKILKALDEASAQTGLSHSTISMAWLLSKKSVTAPIVSATNVEQLVDIAKSAGVTLPKAVLESLNQASSY